MRSLDDIVKFIEKAQGLRKGLHGPFVCGLLKVADSIVEIMQEEGLTDLLAKTKEFENFLLEAVNDDRVTDLESPGSKNNKKGYIQVTGESSTFAATKIVLNTKEEARILNKVLRKVGTNAAKIVKDGVRGSIVLPDEMSGTLEREQACEYITGLEGYDFVEKDGTSNSASDPNRKATVFIGQAPESETKVEIVVLSETEYFKNEHGIRNHKPYEWVQNFQAMCRLWGSVGRSRYDRKIKELATAKYTGTHKGKTHEYTISEDELKAMFADHFYFNTDTGRYHWFEYDFRTNGTEVFSDEYQQKRNKGTIRSIADRAREFHLDLGDVPYNIWSDILENNSFPDANLADDLGYKIIDFLRSVPGVPKLIVKSLEVHLASLDDESHLQSFNRWEVIFSNLGFPDTMPLSDQSEAIKTLEKKDAKTFKFLIQILKTKLATGEVIEMMK